MPHFVPVIAIAADTPRRHFGRRWQRTGRTRRTALAWMLVAGCTPGALALSTDRDQPVNIEADWAEADDQKRVTVYKGKVVIVQGSLRISGDVVTMFFDEDRELIRMVAVGDLARFRQKPDGEAEFQHAKAKRIQYDLLNDTMVLTGQARLSKGADSMRADRIVYDTLRSRIKGESVPADQVAGSESGKTSQGRVHITITPKEKCADGTRRTVCPR